jgi:hypothetical protein
MQCIQQRGAQGASVRKNLYDTYRQAAHPAEMHNGKQRPRPREVQVEKTETGGHYPIVYKRRGNIVLPIQMIAYQKRGQNKQAVDTGYNLFDKG